MAAAKGDSSANNGSITRNDSMRKKQYEKKTMASAKNDGITRKGNSNALTTVTKTMATKTKAQQWQQAKHGGNSSNNNDVSCKHQ